MTASMSGTRFIFIPSPAPKGAEDPWIRAVTDELATPLDKKLAPMIACMHGNDHHADEVERDYCALLSLVSTRLIRDARHKRKNG